VPATARGDYFSLLNDCLVDFSERLDYGWLPLRYDRQKLKLGVPFTETIHVVSVFHNCKKAVHQVRRVERVPEQNGLNTRKRCSRLSNPAASNTRSPTTM
jgi:hypothetical protein